MPFVIRNVRSAVVFRCSEGVLLQQYSTVPSPSYMFSSLVSSKAISLHNSHIVGAQLSGVSNGSTVLVLGVRLIDPGMTRVRLDVAFLKLFVLLTVHIFLLCRLPTGGCQHGERFQLLRIL